jgi:hypothetical protein
MSERTQDTVRPEPELPAPPSVEAAGVAIPEWVGEGLGDALEGLPEEIKRIATGQEGVCEPAAYARYCAPVGIGGQPPWCVYFMAWCWRQATGSSKHAPWENYGYSGFGHTYEVHTWAAQHGQLSQRPGSGMLYGIEDGWEHTGLVLGVNPSTRDLWTINGNWGNCVRTQSWSHAGGRTWSYSGRSHTLFFAQW